MSLKIAVPEISALSVRMLEIVEPLIDDIRRSFGDGGFDDTN
jgi:hypothetical protein